jgi:hypothetical protein
MLEFLTHVSCALNMSAFVVRDMLWLRALAILSSLVWIGAMIGTDSIIVASIFWNVIFIAVNLWQIASLFQENRAVIFNEEERCLYDGLFQNFKPGEFLKFLRLGQWQDLAAGATLVRKGEPTEGIWVLSHGEAEVSGDHGDRKATLGANDLVGEMSFLTQQLPSATVRMRTEGRALFWQKEKLDAFFRLHPTLKIGYQSVISANLAGKLRR